MAMRIPPLRIEIMLESNPLKSIMLVRRLAVPSHDTTQRWHCVPDTATCATSAPAEFRRGYPQYLSIYLSIYIYIYIYTHTYTYTYTCIYIYIYIFVFVFEYVHIYIYICLEMEPVPGSLCRHASCIAHGSGMFSCSDHPEEKKHPVRIRSWPEAGPKSILLYIVYCNIL